MTFMKAHFTALAVAVLLVVGPTLPGHAEDAPAAPPAAAAPAAEPAPASVPRPSLAPKTAEPASAPAADATDPAPRHRRYAHRHWRHHGYYRTAYWEPFPIYFPHLYHNRIHWNRIPWLFRF
jgi:hypothetical protein